ncbi:MAG: TetR/AcrR family transcriptional regulator [Ideonella sp.]|nr:TetR/AcrR family transcriptional regulator [Ideonella sp.]
MAQTKKDGVRDAILAAAFRQFTERGYVETSIPAVAREAGISTANVYVYFKSKIEILYTLYEPWLLERLDRVERSLSRVKTRRERFQRLLVALWRELPRDSNGFANNVMQALSTSGSEEYSPHLRETVQTRVGGWLADCLSLPADDGRRLAGVLLMAFDGYAMNAHLGRGVVCDAKTLGLVGDMLAGSVEA